MLEYLKKHIIEELEGAIDYMEQAVAHKNDSCGSTFMKMSQAELDHANHLVAMFNKQEKPASVSDAQYAAMHKEIMEEYASSMSKVEALKKLYWVM
jgi:hypothetical protein